MGFKNPGRDRFVPYVWDGRRLKTLYNEWILWLLYPAFYHFWFALLISIFIFAGSTLHLEVLVVLYVERGLLHATL